MFKVQIYFITGQKLKFFGVIGHIFTPTMTSIYTLVGNEF